MDLLRKFAQDACMFHVLSAEEEREITTEYAKTRNPKLRDTLVKHNLRLVLKIANEYPRNPDLVGEGAIGLMRGIEKFEPERGLKLSTYVCDWIRAYMISYIVRDARLVKLGTTQAQRKLFFRLNREKARLEAQGQEITPELIARHLDVKEQDVVDMEQRLFSETSLDMPLNEDGGTRLDMLSSDGATPDEALALAEKDSALQKNFNVFRSSLKPNEKIVFDMRMLNDQRLQEVGDKLSVSRERIRQIESRLEDKLRRFCENRKILQETI